MASQESLEKMQLHQNYRNLWHTDLVSALQADTSYCCFSLWCAPCASYVLRALYNDMSGYTCCAVYMPCSGRCGESKCPEFCLATEVFLCFGNSVASTRFLLQDEFNIQTTQCDNCIITQHKIEIDKRDRKFGPQPVMAVPPIQQMSCIDQAIPPSVGYPPQPTYGAQPHGYPPLSAQGYAATGYRPTAYPPPGYPPSGYPW